MSLSTVASAHSVSLESQHDEMLKVQFRCLLRHGVGRVMLSAAAAGALAMLAAAAATLNCFAL